MFDMTKRFMYFEDNNDDTITVTLNLGDMLGPTVENVTVVLEGSLLDLVTDLMVADRVQFAELERISTVVPNEVIFD